jgi:hypothetical protein
MFDGGFDFAGFEGGGGAFGDAFSGASDWLHTHSWSSAQWGESEGIIGRILGVGEGRIGGAIESFISRFGGHASEIFGDYLEWKFYEKVGGSKTHSWEQWNKFGKEGIDLELLEAAKVIKSHSLIREQLEKHADGSELLGKYKDLGVNLPSDDLLKQAKRALSSKIHPDVTGGSDSLMKAVNESIDILGNQEKTKSYRDLLGKAGNDNSLREKIEGFFKKFSGKQTACYEEMARKARLLIPFHGKLKEEMGAAERVSHVIHEGFKNSGQVGRGAIIFGAVASTALFAYYLANRQQKDKTKKTHVESTNREKTQTSIAL